MPDRLQRLYEALQTHVRPATFPVAIRMIAPGEPWPEKTRFPRRDFGQQIAICQGFAIARHYGWIIGMRGEDLSCPLAKVVWGFEPLLDYYLNGMTCAGMYTETPAAGAVSEAQVDKWDYRQWEGVVVAPLHRTAFEPHVVLIYGNSAQVMRLGARLWKTGGRLTSSFSGRIDCADAVITTMKTDECQVILPCYGDRVFGQAQDDEMAFTIPASKIEWIIEGLEGTHKGGIRYPIPKFLRYTGIYPDHYMELERQWAEQRRAPAEGDG
ncbi:MAG: hypothetical protein C4312_04415 [Thermoflexus sp.]